MNETSLEKRIYKKVSTLCGDKGYTKDRYRASELCYCLRKAFIMRKHDIKTQINRYLIAGLMMHERFPKIIKGMREFKNAKYEVECNVDFGEFTISGRADIVTPNAIYELKHAGIKFVNSCPPQYSMQANAYANALDKNQWKIMVVDATNLNVQVYEGTKSTSEYKLFVTRAKQVHEAMHGGEVPEGPEYSWECYFCDKEAKSICEKMREKAEADKYFEVEA